VDQGGRGGVKGVKGKGMWVSLKNYCIRQVSGSSLHSFNRLSKSFHLTLRFDFIRRWPRDSNIIPFFH